MPVRDLFTNSPCVNIPHGVFYIMITAKLIGVTSFGDRCYSFASYDAMLRFKALFGGQEIVIGGHPFLALI